MAAEVWNIGKILSWVTERFKEASFETPRLDAQILICHVLGVEKIHLYTHRDTPLTPSERTHLRALVKRRLDGEPVAYILNEKHWYDLTLYVDPNVLIPRPETESLVDFILETSAALEFETKVIFDFCTGSGCIALALAKHFPTAQVVGVDICPKALEISRQNAIQNQINNVCFVEMDITQPESYTRLQSQYGPACVITANPPYVSLEEWEQLDVSVKNHEPKLALVAPDQGLALGRQVFELVNEFDLLKKDGIFVMEMAENHPQQIAGPHIKKIPFSSTPCQKPRGQWFALCDLENKARFLTRVN